MKAGMSSGFLKITPKLQPEIRSRRSMAGEVGADESSRVKGILYAERAVSKYIVTGGTANVSPSSYYRKKGFYLCAGEFKEMRIYLPAPKIEGGNHV